MAFCVEKVTQFTRRFGAVGLCVLLILNSGQVHAVESRKVEKMIEATLPEEEQKAAAREKQKTLDEGKRLYNRFCFHCHGRNGRGDGLASHYLFPAPRDLSRGIFKFHSTQSNSLPMDEDLSRTIRRGVPGTVMPTWGKVLGEEEIQSLVAYIKTFSERFEQEIPDYQIEVDLEPPFDSISISLGKELYRQLRCSRCHGDEGERTGSLGKNSNDIWGNTSFVFDLRRPELYKTGASSDDMYRMLMAGIGGTPMNSYDYLSADERWHLIHYLQSQFSRQTPLSFPTDDVLVSVPIPGPVGLTLEDSVWEHAPALQVQLDSVRARERPIHSMTVQSVHDGQRIAFRLQWKDPVPDGASSVSSYYLDGVAIQFALQPGKAYDGPFFGMGEREKPVNLWHWKADSTQKIHGPPVNKDHDSPVQKAFTHLSLNPFNESPVEELNAWGFGSLALQSMENQQVSGNGFWKDGMWTVVLVREFKTPSKQDVQFSGPAPVLLAFAVWDGTSRDKNANKMVSFWKTLTLK